MANVIVGDFSQAVFGIRQNAMVEVSTEAENAFAKHLVKVKIS